MMKMKEHPYNYITKENFDTIKTCIEIGLRTQKTPVEIAMNISKISGMPQDIALALINAEFVGVFDELAKTEGK